MDAGGRRVAGGRAPLPLPPSPAASRRRASALPRATRVKRMLRCSCRAVFGGLAVWAGQDRAQGTAAGSSGVGAAAADVAACPLFPTRPPAVLASPVIDPNTPSVAGR